MEAIHATPKLGHAFSLKRLIVTGHSSNTKKDPLHLRAREFMKERSSTIATDGSIISRDLMASVPSGQSESFKKGSASFMLRD